MPAVALLSLEIHVPHARSLKDKRAVVRSVKDRLRRFNVSVAEIDHQSLRQRCRLGIAAVGGSRVDVERLLGGAVDEIERHDPGLVIATEIEWLA